MQLPPNAIRPGTRGAGAALKNIDPRMLKMLMAAMMSKNKGAGPMPGGQGIPMPPQGGGAPMQPMMRR